MKKRGDNHRKTMKTALRTLLPIIVTLLSLSGCATPFTGNGDRGTGGESPEPERVDTGFVVTGPESFDSADTAVLSDINEEESTMTFLNLELGRKYTLSLDGTTRLYDKYGSAISQEQVQKGDIVDVTFLKSEKHLTSLRLSSKSWVFENAERYEMNAVRGEVLLGDEVYKLTSNTQYLSDGKNVELMDLNAADVLSFQGIGNQIFSVRVEKGHGYLRLVNEEKFVGGWIEVGQSLIQRITEEMLLLVPEGDYQVNISNKGGGGIKEVSIKRNEETALDIGDLEVPEPQTGMVFFTVSPTDAELYIDGEAVDTSGPVTLEYGLHQMIVRAEGYQSITQYIRVSQESAAIDVALDEVSGTEEEEESDSESSSSTVVDTTTGYYRVNIDAPEGVEVYLDGHYVGISPCSFRKEEGSHVIILRKQGYETRSYTVEVDGEEKDISYTFAELEKYGSEEDDEKKESPSPSPSPTPGDGEESTPSPTPSPAPTPSPTPEPTPPPAPTPSPTPVPTPPFKPTPEPGEGD